MSFIKSIVGWFKRKKDEPEQKSYGGISRSEPAYWGNSNFGLVANYQLKGIDRDIEEILKAIAVAEKSKKKRSHLRRKYRALKLQRLQIENKISDYKNVW